MISISAYDLCGAVVSDGVESDVAVSNGVESDAVVASTVVGSSILSDSAVIPFGGNGNVASSGAG